MLAIAADSSSTALAIREEKNSLIKAEKNEEKYSNKNSKSEHSSSSHKKKSKKSKSKSRHGPKVCFFGSLTFVTLFNF